MVGSGTADRADGAAQSAGVSTAAATHTREVDPLAVTRRLQREGRWKDVEPERDEMMKLARKRGMSKSEAQAWAYAELDRMYPPLTPVYTTVDKPDLPTSGIHSEAADAGAIQGLSDLPGDWPELPANATLSTEVGWVQANRLRIVTEQPGRATLVKLHQALSPAPSWAALGWLETSIRSYAKYVDVAAKATSSDDGDEGAVMRRERKSIDELRALLAEMEEDEGECPHCGRS